MWIAPDGTTLTLTDRSNPWWAIDWYGVVGAAPLTLTADPHPRGGSRVRATQPQSRVMVVTIRVGGSTNLEFTEAVHKVAHAFTQTSLLGPGRLRITRADGTAREIIAWYDGGIVGETGMTELRDVFAVRLFAEDPHWRDVEPIVETRRFSEPADYYDPYATLSSGQVLGDTTLINGGDIFAYPEWTLTGPMSSFTATNTTTGEEFVLSSSLSAGEQATITTDPPTVRGPSGENWSGQLNWPEAVLWGLRPGPNRVTFNAAGAAEGTSVQLRYWRGWQTP